MLMQYCFNHIKDVYFAWINTETIVTFYEDTYKTNWHQSYSLGTWWGIWHVNVKAY